MLALWLLTVFPCGSVSLSRWFIFSPLFPSPKTLCKMGEKGYHDLSCCCLWSCSPTYISLGRKPNVTKYARTPHHRVPHNFLHSSPTSLLTVLPMSQNHSHHRSGAGCSHLLEGPFPGSLPTFHESLQHQLPQPQVFWPCSSVSIALASS